MADRRDLRLDLRLYVVLDPEHTRGRRLADVAGGAIAGGATVVQVRAKQATTRGLMALAEAVLAVARPAGVPVLVNDRPDVALAAGAGGVHLGEDDLPVAAARAMLGARGWIGYSPATAAAARLARRDGADYLGVGDVFGTVTKRDAGTPIGLDGLAAIAGATDLPVIAIGGVHAANAADCIRAGASGVAVVTAVTGADDIEAAARALRVAVDRALADIALGSAGF